MMLKTLSSKAGWVAVEEALLTCNIFRQNPLHVACLWRSYRIVRFFVTSDFENTFSRTRLSARVRKSAKSLRRTLIKTLLCTLRT